MIKKRMEMRGQGGFTLIELLVVIAILGILAGVVVFAVSNITDGAKKNACKIEKRSLQTAIEAAKASDDPSDTWQSFTDTSTTPKYWTVSGTTLTRTLTSEVSVGDCG
ncbi:MAG: type II secretion system protein [Microthrixaceae bacterium]